MIHEEEWKTIEDFPEYQVSSLGRIINIHRPNTARKQAINHAGFPTVVLFKTEHPGSRYLRQVNKLVATAFLGPPPPKMDSVWHLDGDLENCYVDNLVWDMRSRVLEWNDMHRTLTPRYKTPPVMINETGKIYANAFECGMAVSEIETAVVTHIENYPAQHAHRARYRYVVEGDNNV